MSIGKEIVEVLKNNNCSFTVNELKNALGNNYSSKQVGTEIRRINEWSLLGKKWITKSTKVVQNLRKNGKMGKIRILNCYQMKFEACASHIEVLLTLTRGAAFNHHGQKVEARKKIVNNTKTSVNNLSLSVITSPIVHPVIKNIASAASRRVNKITNLKTKDCY